MTKREIWTKHVAEWRLSGLTREQYCARHNIGAASLSWWARELREAASSLAPLAKAKAEVHLAQVVAPGKSAAVELRFGDVLVRVERGVDTATLRTVIEVLKDMRCG